MVTPILLDNSAYAAYFLFGGLALGTTIVLAAYMPETRGRSLEDIQDAFHRPQIKNIQHYLRGVLPGRQPRAQQVQTSAGLTSSTFEMNPGPITANHGSIGPVSRSLRLDVATA